jgi:Zn-dependent protease with chaperone function
MTIAITLLLGAAIVGVCAPALLRRLAARTVDPVVVIVGWMLAVVGVLATATAGLVVMTVPAEVAETPLAHLVRRPWWSAVHDAPAFAAYRLAGWIAGALLVTATLRLCWVAISEHRGRRARVRGQLDVLRMVGTSVPCPNGGPPTLWLQSDRPVAFSLGGRPGTVVLTDGLRRHLPPGGLDAVLAHERAHVRGHHHLLVAVADVLAATFPFVRLFRVAPAALREQVELAADTEAVRACGPDALRAALMGVTGAGSPEGALAMARTAVDVRLRYLAAVSAPPSRLGRFSRCGSLGALLACTPLLATVVLLWALSALATAATVLS